LHHFWKLRHGESKGEIPKQDLKGPSLHACTIDESIFSNIVQNTRLIANHYNTNQPLAYKKQESIQRDRDCNSLFLTTKHQQLLFLDPEASETAEIETHKKKKTQKKRPSRIQ
jgi:hypothetical protein